MLLWELFLPWVNPKLIRLDPTGLKEDEHQSISLFLHQISDTCSAELVF